MPWCLKLTTSFQLEVNHREGVVEGTLGQCCRQVNTLVQFWECFMHIS